MGALQASPPELILGLKIRGPAHSSGWSEPETVAGWRATAIGYRHILKCASHFARRLWIFLKTIHQDNGLNARHRSCAADRTCIDRRQTRAKAAIFTT
jgi:hypothetical protein